MRKQLIEQKRSKQLSYLLRHDKAYPFKSGGWRTLENLIQEHSFRKEAIVDLVEKDDNGGFDVTERGFCYDTKGNPSIDTEHKYLGGGDYGYYQITINSLAPNTKYFVRAYAKNKNGVSYSNMLEFKTEKGAEDIGFVEIPALGIAVQTEDIGVRNWISINAMCENSIVGGYTDWRLPTIDELMSIYTYRNMIGNFDTDPSWSNYWSSDKYTNDSFYGIDFSKGALMQMGYEYEYGRGRCVRTLNSK